MDVKRLSQTLAYIREDEARLKIQEKLVAVETALQNLSSNPAEPTYQVSLSTAMSELQSAISSLVKSYDPSQTNRIIEIGAEPFFTEKMIQRIQLDISSNPMSPATALADVSKLREERKEFIDRVKRTETGVDSFVPYSTGLEPGESAIGFELPRALFDNEFKDFIAELRTIQRIMRVFAEVELGTVPEFKLGQISSSDPLERFSTAMNHSGISTGRDF
jgi:hypothetical protein